ncbi:MAG TPA: hypothetical protein DDZ80_26465 [Cyanobacteria bacterium UBA8803]|nr:hypothetical protein [Cyanobacteria bacterium UBA9273]HBL61827.1 hypothetical protein [Cyanobacteria bacterium UBA8803]
METKLPEPGYADTPEFTTTELNRLEAATGDVPLLAPPQPETEMERISKQVIAFLENLPDYLGEFFNEYKQPITIVALIVGTIITAKVVLAILDALDNIPLMGLSLELIGLTYLIWFVYRYLLKASDRQELWGEINRIKQQVLGDKA